MYKGVHNMLYTFVHLSFIFCTASHIENVVLYTSNFKFFYIYINDLLFKHLNMKIFCQLTYIWIKIYFFQVQNDIKHIILYHIIYKPKSNCKSKSFNNWFCTKLYKFFHIGLQFIRNILFNNLFKINWSNIMC